MVWLLPINKTSKEKLSLRVEGGERGTLYCILCTGTSFTLALRFEYYITFRAATTLERS